MKTAWALRLLVLSLYLSCISAHAEDGPEKVATAAAEKWLGQIDAGGELR